MAFFVAEFEMIDLRKDRKQRLFVISGPSGCGKATLLKYVTDHTDIKRVVTYTTRKPRPGEVDGVDYNFVSKEEFERMYEDGELMERERVYGDFFYGSPRDVFAGSDADVIMELDTKGTENYRKIYDGIITIFILPPSIDELIRRIESRHPEANMDERLAVVRPQLLSASSYDYLVVNDIVERAGEEILEIIETGYRNLDREEKLKLAAKLVESVNLE
jgi:guanylate kinase